MDRNAALIGGRFRLEHALGKGGMATVFSATDVATGKPIAIKLLRIDEHTHPAAVSRFRREGEILTSLHHQAIVRIETFGEADDGRFFIAMERLTGETLGELLRRRGRLVAKELESILREACEGLSAAHAAGVIHRDLKPDNVFLCTEDVSARPSVKLLDFGVSKMRGGDKLTRTGEIVGTPRYMAPEQLAAEADQDARIDVYAMGVIAYEALAGRPPFPANTPSELVVAILSGRTLPLSAACPGIASEIEGVVARAMAKNKDERFPSVAVFAQAFEDAVTKGEHAGTGPSAKTQALGSFHVSVVVPGAHADAAPAASFSVWDETAPVADSATDSLSPSEEKPYRYSRRQVALVALLSALGSAGVALLVLKNFEAAEEVASAHRSASHRIRQTSTTSAVSAQPAVGAEEPLSEARHVLVSGREAPEILAPSHQKNTAKSTRQSRPEGERSHILNKNEAKGRASRVTSSAPSSAPLPVEDIAAARAALRAGNLDECLGRLDRAIQAGAPAIAFRLKGDCLIRAGHVREGLDSYHRFCTLAPDHPGIDEVRSIVESYGERCP